ncbi:uncharacterized protein LOC117913797 isoform X1 [Vitis riparia]|uniref:uncharacterized protein LOC117913797 isoform X1 n=1 Tax=Vitis riparia TaxID=96939 RepID=UPI00155ABB9C|nr:uncharacterized protein LOC117913797 isoform X1 [Vitis riparia]
MSKKRSRVVWSSSLGDTGLFNNIQPIETPAAVSRPKPKQWERPRRSILTLGSPLKDSNHDGSDIDESFGVFLQSCFCCRRKISPKDDVFMSGCVYMRYLRAFCSKSCRTTHIALEEAEQDAASRPTQATDCLTSI